MEATLAVALHLPEPLFASLEALKAKEKSNETKKAPARLTRW